MSELPAIVAEAKPAELPAARPLGMPTAVSADLLEPPRRLHSLGIVAMSVMLGAFVYWSAQAAMSEFTIGQGKVIPASRVQVVQNLEGGMVRAIAVREGQRVAKGDLLLSIDPTAPGSQLGEAREKAAALQAAVLRLDAELKGASPEFPAELRERRPELVANELALFESRRREIESALSALDLAARQREQEVIETKAKIESLTGVLALARREQDLIRPLLATGAAPRIEGLRAESKVVETEGQLRAAELALPRVEAALLEVRDRRREKAESQRTEAFAKLSQQTSELAALAQAMRTAEDKLRRTDMTAPVNGIVKTLAVSTLGQVIAPGSSAVEIVPLDETLLVEAQVRPQDIAFLRPGLEAKVKLTAYDATIYGGLKGKLEHIGADSVTNDKGDTFFIIRIRTDSNVLTHRGRDLPIMPGMVAEVEIRTGQKTVLQYLMKPVTRMQQQALRER